jgi:hypothetical protein
MKKETYRIVKVPLGYELHLFGGELDGAKVRTKRKGRLKTMGRKYMGLS